MIGKMKVVNKNMFAQFILGIKYYFRKEKDLREYIKGEQITDTMINNYWNGMECNGMEWNGIINKKSMWILVLL